MNKFSKDYLQVWVDQTNEMIIEHYIRLTTQARGLFTGTCATITIGFFGVSLDRTYVELSKVIEIFRPRVLLFTSAC